MRHHPSPCRRAAAAARRGFSVIEMLIALTISSLLLSACLVSLDGSFKAYEVTTDSASTHVVSRLVMHRVLGMIRTGESFGPYPVGIVTPTQIESSYVEFVSLNDESTGERQVTRLERAEDPAKPGLFRLVFKRWDYLDGAQTGYLEHPLLSDVRQATFLLEYDVGPRLRRATIDLTLQPNDADPTVIHSDLDAPVLRLVASASPRKLTE